MCANEKETNNLPQSKFQKAIYALLTVSITVHAYVFYSLNVPHGTDFMQRTGANSVLEVISKMGDVMMFGTYLSIWALVAVELVLAYTLEMTIGSSLFFKLACRSFDPRSTSSGAV